MSDRVDRAGHYLATHPRFILIGILLLVLAATCGHIHQLEEKLRLARIQEAVATLRLQGFTQGKVSKDITSTTPTLASKVKAAIKGGAIPGATARTIYERVEVPIIIPCDSPAIRDSVTNGTEVKAENHILAMSADHQLALALTPDGKPWWTSTLFVDASIDDGPQVHVEMLPSTVKSTFTLSTDIERAINEYTSKPPRVSLNIRPLRHWRTGWVAGAGLTYDPFESHTSVGGFVGYGISF